MSIELKPWPLNHYAPGGYFCTCAVCLKTFEGDKRALQCLECAVLAQKEALAAKDAEIAELKRKFFPYAEATQICGTSWDGKYLIGNKESIRYFREMQNRGEQIDVFRKAYEQNILAKDAEIARLREALELDIGTARDLISDWLQ